jgi:hypothetical protein
MITWHTFQPASRKKESVHWDAAKNLIHWKKEKNISKSALIAFKNVNFVKSIFLNKCKADIIVFLILKRNF